MARLVVLDVWSGPPAAAAAEASPGSLIDMQIRDSLNQELWGRGNQGFNRPPDALILGYCTVGSPVMMGWSVNLFFK